MIRLIACDMDGTLLNEDGRISKEFFQVFKEIKKKGIKFAVASGRQYSTLVNNFESISNEIIYIAENGTLIKHKNEEIHSCIVKREYVMEIVEDSKNIEGIFLILCGKDYAYVDTTREEVLIEVKKYYHNHKIVNDLRSVQEDILKIAVLDFKGSEGNSNKFFCPRWGERLKVSVSGEIWLDIYNKEANKGTAIELLQKQFGIKKEETMAFGDYFNDVEMLKAAHYSYAMANAPDEVKTYARFIARSNRENGVVEAIKEVVLKVC